MTILTRQQLFDTLGIKADLLRRLHAEGLPHLQISARVCVYIQEDVVAWLRERNEAGGGAAGDPPEAAPARAPARKRAGASGGNRRIV